MTYKRTVPGGADMAIAKSKCPVPPMPPYLPVPPYPYYPCYEKNCELGPAAEDKEKECPVPMPPVPPIPPYPYPYPKPEKVDESSKRLAKLTESAKTLVQMIKDFEQKNKPAILTVGNHSYQFGTDKIIDFSGE